MSSQLLCENTSPALQQPSPASSWCLPCSTASSRRSPSYLARSSKLLLLSSEIQQAAASLVGCCSCLWLSAAHLLSLPAAAIKLGVSSCWPLTTMARNDFGFGSLIIDIKLDGSNYREWAFSARTVLRTAGFVSHLTDDPSSPNDGASRKSGKRSMIV